MNDQDRKPRNISQRQGALGSSQGDTGAREADPVLQPGAEGEKQRQGQRGRIGVSSPAGEGGQGHGEPRSVRDEVEPTHLDEGERIGPGNPAKGGGGGGRSA